MKCPWCGGRGWEWVGVGGNAVREECEPCRGTGLGSINWGAWAGLLAILASAGLMVALIVWTTTKYGG